MPRITSLLVFFFTALTGMAQWAQIGWEPVVSGLERVVHVTGSGDGSGRLFVVEQSGLVRILNQGELAAKPFLDLRERVGFEEERGLLNIAFPPTFPKSNRVYAYFTDAEGTVTIARYSVSADGTAADPATEEIILQVPNEYGQHNGGGMAFSPVDGMLYLGIGDGGIQTGDDGIYIDDPYQAGQDGQQLRGKILRLDVEGSVAPYDIPADNPRQEGWLPEIWSIGWRNPWRLSFDSANGTLYVGDVGADAYEEVNIEAAGRGGRNYGWSVREGNFCLGTDTCPEREDLTAPAVAYAHNEGCSVTGGVVYRGKRFPELNGVYVFGDYCRGPVWSLRRVNGEWRRLGAGLTRALIVSFGTGDDGEVYMVDYRGTISRLLQVPPGLRISGVGNGASGEEGMVPGSIASVFASGWEESDVAQRAEQWPLPATLAGVTVWVNGTQAGIAAITVEGKVDFQVPYAVPAGPAEVQMRAGFKVSNVHTVEVRPVQPGLFTASGLFAMAVNEQGEMTSRFAPGAAAVLYGTGFGMASNAPPYGYPTPAEPEAPLQGTPKVTIGGQAAEVAFCALAPGFAGVYALVVRIPGELESGEAEVVVEIDSQRSPAVKLIIEAAAQ